MLRSTTPLLLVLSLSLCACRSKSQLDGLATTLVTATKQNDYDAFSAISHPSAIASFPRAKMQLISKALGWLGKLEQRKMLGIDVGLSGAPDVGRYELRYEKGTLRLSLAASAGKIAKFSLEGDALTQAIVELGQVEVTFFAWLQRAGGPARQSNVYKLGETAFYRLEAMGMQEQAHTIWGKLAIRIERDGELVFDKPDFKGSKIDTARNAEDGIPPMLVTRGSFTPPLVGNYRILFTVTDGYSKRTTTHEQMLTVRGSES